MTGARPLPFPYSRGSGTTSRFRLALAVSVLIHLLIAAALVSEMPQGKVQDVSAVPLAVRLDPLKTVVPDIETAGEKSLKRRRSRRLAVNSEDMRRDAPIRPVSATSQDAVQPRALPQSADPIVYAARDLDSYPRPAVPLDLERFANRAGGFPPAGIRLELIIDEHGIVNHVAHTDAGTAGMLESELHAMIAASRFIPARKDGRAVKSRVLISVDFLVGERGR